MKAHLLSSASPLALRVAMPPRDLAREAELTAKARQMADKLREFTHEFDVTETDLRTSVANNAVLQRLRARGK